MPASSDDLPLDFRGSGILEAGFAFSRNPAKSLTLGSLIRGGSSGGQELFRLAQTGSLRIDAKARTALERATGQTLAAHNIEFDEAYSGELRR